MGGLCEGLSMLQISLRVCHQMATDGDDRGFKRTPNEPCQPQGGIFQQFQRD